MSSYSTTLLVIILFLLSSCGSDKKSVKSNTTGNEALDQLNVLIEKDSTDHSLYFERAKLYYENSFYDGAIQDLERAISLDSLNPEYYHLLSDSYMDNYKSKEALRAIEECIELFPERIPSLLKLAETELILKQYDNSLQTCSNILTINPMEAEAYFMMGMNLRSTGDIARAKNAFRKATELDPELIDAWIILGQLFEDENNPKALEYYDAAINLDRENPIPWHSKAYYLQNHDRIGEALEIYRKINIIDKDYLEAYLNAGLIYMSLDSINKAYEQFNIMTKVKPQFYQSYYYRGMANEALGRPELAMEDYTTSLKLNGNFQKAQQAINRLTENQFEAIE